MEWANQIDANLNEADIILLLVSPDFVNSDYCFSTELEQAIRRHEAEKAIFVPVVLEPCDWSWLPFGKFQAFPKNAKAITTWTNQNEAFLDVATGIRKVAQELFEKRQQQAEQKKANRAQYQQKVEEFLQDGKGKISWIEQDTLDELAEELGLTIEEAKAIQSQAREPYERYEANLEKYKQTLIRSIQRGDYPFNQETERALERRQRDLGLKPEDVAQISKPILDQAELDEQAKKQRLAEAARLQELERQRQRQQQEYATKLERYRQEFFKAVEAEYPLHPAALENLKTFRHQLELKDEDVEAIAAPILAAKQTEYEQQQAIARQQAEQAAQRNQPNSSPNPTQSVAPKPAETISSQTFEFTTAKLTIAQKQGWLGSKNTVEINRGKGHAEYFVENLGNSVTLEMVKIPAGEFMMGAATGEESSGDDERPQHRVKVPEFWMGKFAVTQEQWNQVAKLPKVKLNLNPDPSRFEGDKHPVECVSWDETVELCTRLSRRTGKTYRLPTEAEWEYACRAGTATPFYFGETITPDLVNFDGSYTYGNAPKGEYRGQTTDVGNFPANAFGLCDMNGNVWEWCADQWCGSYANKPDLIKQNGAIAWTQETTGVSPKSDETEYRLLRGGSWLNYPRNCRSAYRYGYPRDTRGNFIGFRVVCSVPRTS
jgi:formylglycine-generating enzyme required for sulfatase activity